MANQKSYFNKIINYLKNPLRSKYLLFLMHHGYLHEKGWLNSLVKNEIVGKNNEAIPWLSYPAIDFLQEVIPATAKVFEFGAGNSTIYFSKRYASVTSVENDQEWFNKLSGKLTTINNCKLILAPERDEYINALAKTSCTYDLIIVDGRWRKPCLIEAVKFLNINGFIVLDDADRTYYQPAIDVLKEKGFYSAVFNGMSACSFDNHSTMIFWAQK